VLLGILYRSPAAGNDQEWVWTAVEEKNLFAQLILNNLRLIYPEDVIRRRPNDRGVRTALTSGGSLYIIDANVERLQIAIGWDFVSDGGGDGDDEVDDDDQVAMVKKKKKKKKAVHHDGDDDGDEIDIDVDASVVVFSRVEHEENDKGVEEETCEQLDVVNLNNNFYKTYVKYLARANAVEQFQPLIAVQKEKKEEDIAGAAHGGDKDDEEEDDELGDVELRDEAVFEVDIAKMNGDNNEIGSLCVTVNIYNDNNMQNKGKTNNVRNCYLRLIDVKNDRFELCRFSVRNINADKKTNALALGCLQKLENNCWALTTNDVAFKNQAKMDWLQYAKQVVLTQYSEQNGVPKNSCCFCTLL